MEIKDSSLDNPDYAQFAWGRYRKLMIWMAGAAIVTTGLGLWFVSIISGPISWIIILMVSLGIFVTIMLAAALMGLVFLSHGSGHDEAVDDGSPPV